MTIMQALHNIGNTIMTKHGLDDKAINTNAIREFMRNISEP